MWIRIALDNSAGAILHAFDSDSNPKRKQGAQLLSSITLRVTVSCVIFDRVQLIARNPVLPRVTAHR